MPIGFELEVPTFVGWDQLLASAPTLDVVDVVTPNADLGAITLAAIERGLHVLVEKPLATTVAACDAIVDAARRSGRVVAVGHELRLSPLWGRVAAEIMAGRIGRPLSCTIHLWRRSFRPGAGGWRHDPARVGNWILEEPIHYFDPARWYLADLGDPVAVYARGNGRGGALPENVAALVSWANGGFTRISQTTAGAEHHLIAEITGTEASLQIVWSGLSDRGETPTCRLDLAANDVQEELPLNGTPTETGDLAEEIARMVRCVRDGKPPPTDAVDGRWAVRLALAAEASAQSGHKVAV